MAELLWSQIFVKVGASLCGRHNRHRLDAHPTTLQTTARLRELHNGTYLHFVLRNKSCSSCACTACVPQSVALPSSTKFIVWRFIQRQMAHRCIRSRDRSRTNTRTNNRTSYLKRSSSVRFSASAKALYTPPSQQLETRRDQLPAFTRTCSPGLEPLPASLRSVRVQRVRNGCRTRQLSAVAHLWRKTVDLRECSRPHPDEYRMLS